MASGQLLEPQQPVSPSLPSDLYLTPDIVARTGRDACDRIQLVADILLLRSKTSSYQPPSTKQPIALHAITTGNESYSKSRDVIVANTKALAISIKNITQNLHKRNLGGIYRTMENMTEQIIVLTEAATQAAYFTALTDSACKPAIPGVVDHYTFERAGQAIHMTYDLFKPDFIHSMTRGQILQISRTFATNLALLTQGCKLASDNRLMKETDRAQFANLVVCLQGTTSAFLSSLKLFASNHSEDNRKRCLLFGKPLLAAVDSTIEFCQFPQFSGKAAVLSERGVESQTEILGGAMAIVGCGIQLLDTTADLLERDSTESWKKMVNCCKAVADSAKILSGSIRDHTPMPSRRESLN